MLMLSRSWALVIEAVLNALPGLDSLHEVSRGPVGSYGMR